MRTLRAILPLLLVAVSPRLHAQDTPLWRYTANEEISFYRITPLGDLAVATRDKLTVLDAETGQEIWSRTDIPDLREGAFDVISYTPYGVVRSKDGIALIDLTSGVTLWDSTTIALKVRGYFAILPHEMMLVYGETAESDNTLMAVDLETGALLWRQDLLLAQKPPLEKIDGIHTFAGHQLPLLDTDSTMIVFISGDGPLKIHVGTGELIWGVPALAGKYPPLLSEWYAPMHLAGGALYVSYDDGPVGLAWPLGGSTHSNDEPRFMALNQSDGRVIWDKELHDASDPPRSALRETIQVAEAEVVSLYDRFQADLKAKGFTAERAPEAPGGWVVTGVQPVSESTRRAILSLLEHVERFPEGLLVSSAPLAVEGRQVINLLDLKTGEAIWSRGVLIESAAEALVVDSRVYVAEPDGLLAVDLNTGTSSTIGTYEFEGCEVPALFAQLEDALLLRSEHNLMMLDKGGAVRFHRSYRSGRCGSKAVRDIAKVIGVSARVGLFVVQSMAAGVDAHLGAEPRDVDLTLLDFSWLQNVDQQTVQRFELALEAGEHAFMSDRAGSAYSVVKVRMLDGEEIERVGLGENSQDHLVDDISGTVFVKQGDRGITAFRFPDE
jgi:outer membrane protein assembly factor BamB